LDQLLVETRSLSSLYFDDKVVSNVPTELGLFGVRDKPGRYLYGDIMNRSADFMKLVATVASTCLLLVTAACSSGPALQSDIEHATIKTALIEGERVLRANSCSTLPSLGIMDSKKLEFGACYLTNLRLVFEESDWYRAMKTTAAFVPTRGDFGISELASGGKAVLDNYYISNLGRQDQLGVVEIDSRLIIPLSAIRWMEIAQQTSSFTAMLSNEEKRGKRNIKIVAGNGRAYFLEVYNLPPHKTGFMPDYLTQSWMENIQQVKARTYGEAQ
jgi:hypothetical protein